MRYVVIVALLAMAGCYHPNPAIGAPCGVGDVCPAPLVCEGGVCTTSLDGAVDSSIDGPDLTCTCTTGTTLSCASGAVSCALGCAATPNAHCEVMIPSNNVLAGAATGATDITIGGLATFDTDTGAISGALVRPAGTGIVAGIGYEIGTYGVFTFQHLTIDSTATIRFRGSHAAIFLAGSDVTIHGVIDASAGCYGMARSCAGPGGGAGAIYTATAGGCGPGGGGTSDAATGADTGGGGGGAGSKGASGGVETAASTMFPGGTAGVACLASTLEPLAGGSGGGGGGPGASATPTFGGGGGGAIQISSLSSIFIDGTILAAGAGGDTGPTDANNGGTGGGGGGGGAILLEAPVVEFTPSAIVAANGGGGGGGSDHLTVGQPGQNGQPTGIPAVGGAGANTAGAGGDGGADVTDAKQGASATNVNAGAGGGGVGVIFIRPIGTTTHGIVSPPAGFGDLRAM